LAIVGTLNGVLDEKIAATIVGVLNAVYTVMRTLAKSPVAAETVVTEGRATTTVFSGKGEKV